MEMESCVELRWRKNHKTQANKRTSERVNEQASKKKQGKIGRWKSKRQGGWRCKRKLKIKSIGRLNLKSICRLYFFTHFQLIFYLIRMEFFIRLCCIDIINNREQASKDVFDLPTQASWNSSLSSSIPSWLVDDDLNSGTSVNRRLRSTFEPKLPKLINKYILLIFEF